MHLRFMTMRPCKLTGGVPRGSEGVEGVPTSRLNQILITKIVDLFGESKRKVENIFGAVKYCGLTPGY